MIVADDKSYGKRWLGSRTDLLGKQIPKYVHLNQRNVTSKLLFAVECVLVFNRAYSQTNVPMMEL